MACEELTKKGTPCQIGAIEGTRLCHVHTPELQCGVVRNGKACRIPTGGRGTCPAHSRPAATSKPRRERRPRYSPEEREARRLERQRAEREKIRSDEAAILVLDGIARASEWRRLERRADEILRKSRRGASGE